MAEMRESDASEIQNVPDSHPGRPFCFKILFSERGRVRSIFNGFGRTFSRFKNK
jgi:hypothetical protein